MGWKGIRRVSLAAASVFWLSACAVDYPSTQFLSSALKADPTAGFANRVSSSQVVLYWNCMRPESGMLRVEGVAYNPWSDQAIRFLEFDLVGVVDWDRQVSATSAALPAILLQTNEVSPFRLDLRTVGTETRFDLYYQYRFNYGNRGIFAGPPGAASQRLAQQLRQFLVRDVCSETQHRIR